VANPVTHLVENMGNDPVTSRTPCCILKEDFGKKSAVVHEDQKDMTFWLCHEAQLLGKT